MAVSFAVAVQSVAAAGSLAGLRPCGWRSATVDLISRTQMQTNEGGNSRYGDPSPEGERQPLRPLPHAANVPAVLHC